MQVEQICPRQRRDAGLPCFRFAGSVVGFCSLLLQNKYGFIWSALSASLPAAPPLTFSPAALMRQLRSLTCCQPPPNFSPHSFLLSQQWALLSGNLVSKFMCPLHETENRTIVKTETESLMPTFSAQAELSMHKSSIEAEQLCYCVRTDNTAS